MPGPERDASSGFDLWWTRFVGETAGDATHEAADRLRRKIRSVPLAARPDFLRRLWVELLRHRNDYGLVLLSLDAVRDRDRLGDLADAMAPLPGRLAEDAESHLADLVRLLAAANDPALLRVVEAYLLERPIGPCWPVVPWALWPARRELFARSWCRYAREVPSTRWDPALVLDPFLGEPGAVEAIRDALGPAWGRFRSALERRAAEAAWLGRSRREALARTLS